MWIRAGLVFFLICITLGVSAQSNIIDDSTKQVYGAYTTFFQRYEDIKYNKDNLQKIDTTFGNMHRFSEQSKHDNKIQNLGFLGTAMHPVFYELPTEVGITSGYNAYIPYYLTANDIEYYDTRSPYTLLDVVIGGKGRAVTNIKHARNINPYWNAGFHFKKINADKQVASTGKGDNQTSSTAYTLHTDYQSPNGKYAVLGNINRINHKVWEQGGINVPAGAPVNDYFDPDAAVFLNYAQSQDYRLGLQIYNQYKVRDQFQLYYNFQTIENRNFFTDNPLDDPNATDISFYKQILINSDSTTDQAQTNQLINEFGIKGDYEKMFYSFNIKFRNVKNRSNYLPNEKLYFENSGGFVLRYDFDSLQNIKASGEYILGGFYRFGGAYFMKFFTVEYWRTQSRPAIIEDSYFGNNFYWENNFATPSSDLLKGSLIYKSNFMRIEPFASVTNVKNNIYYGYDQAPAQATGSARLLSFGLDLNLTFFKKIFWENEGIYTNVSGDSEAVNSFRIPEIFINTKLYYGSYWFEGKIFMMLGVDAHYQSEYYAPAYNPSVQQFYLQDDFLIPAYTSVDAFIEFQIDQLSAFLKLQNINYGNDAGYFTFPYYIGQPKVFDIGVRWMFYN